MSLLGKLVAAPFRLANIPLRVGDAIADLAMGGDGKPTEDERIISRPLDALAETVEDVVDGIVEDEC